METKKQFDTKKFKTRTLFLDRSNGSVDGVFLTAIDVGFSGVKVFSQNFVGVFPSFAKRLDGELVGTPAPENIIYKDLATGKNGSWVKQPRTTWPRTTRRSPRK